MFLMLLKEKVCILFSISLLVIILIKRKEIICHLEKLDYNKLFRNVCTQILNVDFLTFSTVLL